MNSFDWWFAREGNEVPHIFKVQLHARVWVVTGLSNGVGLGAHSPLVASRRTWTLNPIVSHVPAARYRGFSGFHLSFSCVKLLSNQRCRTEGLFEQTSRNLHPPYMPHAVSFIGQKSSSA